MKARIAVASIPGEESVLPLRCRPPATRSFTDAAPGNREDGDQASPMLSLLMSISSPADDLPVLYVISGSATCNEMAAFLDDHGVGYRKINISEQPSTRLDMEKVSGQSRTPVLDWHGRVLAGFNREELVAFLRSRDVKLEDS
jgi:glutaredoxin 3